MQLESAIESHVNTVMMQHDGAMAPCRTLKACGSWCHPHANLDKTADGLASLGGIKGPVNL